MDWRSLAQDVDQARSRVEDLRGRSASAGVRAGHAHEAHRSGLVTEAFAELDTAFEELGVAQEALRDHAEQLVDTRRALADQDWAYRQLLSAGSAGFLTSTLEGLIIDSNPRAGGLLMVEPRFLGRKLLASFVHVSERSVFRQRLNDLARSGRGPHTWTQPFLLRNGDRTTLTLTVVLCQSTAGAILLWRLVPDEGVDRGGTDHDRVEHWSFERFHAEVARLVAERTRELEERDHRKDEFLATLSHEMRTPLNVIVGYASLLRTGALSEEATVKAIAAIERNAAVQSKLVADLLDVSRIAAGRLSLSMQPIDFSTVVASAVDSARPLMDGKQVQLRHARRDAPLQVLADDRRMQQVVGNLLSNAAKFTPSGGTVDVSLAPRAGQAVLQISDTGIGIRPEFLRSLFHRFTQDHARGEAASSGLGLGLSIVKHIVELHHGTIRADSAGPGHGSTFTVALPVLDA